MPPRILIVDADPAARAQVTDWLEAADCECLASDTARALPDTRLEKPDVVVIAIANPHEGGMWVVRRLCAQPDRVGVVVIATRPDFDIASAANRLGVVDCLPGPASREEIVDAVRRAVLWRTAVDAATDRTQAIDAELAFGRRYLRDTVEKVDPEAAQTVLLAVLEARCPEAHLHAQRVAHAAVAIARSRNLTPADVQEVRRAALLHDIGKIALPDRLLSGDVPLSEEDEEAFARHVSIGQEVLASVPALASAGRIVAALQERIDGTGRPLGLAGAEIPVGARVIAVADTYDVLTTPHTRHAALSADDANAELVRAAGSHLDPDIVRAWIGLEDVVKCS